MAQVEGEKQLQLQVLSELIFAGKIIVLKNIYFLSILSMCRFDSN